MYYLTILTSLSSKFLVTIILKHNIYLYIKSLNIVYTLPQDITLMDIYVYVNFM